MEHRMLPQGQSQALPKIRRSGLPTFPRHGIWNHLELAWFLWFTIACKDTLERVLASSQEQESQEWHSSVLWKNFDMWCRLHVQQLLKVELWPVHHSVWLHSILSTMQNMYNTLSAWIVAKLNQRISNVIAVLVFRFCRDVSTSESKSNATRTKKP